MRRIAYLGLGLVVLVAAPASARIKRSGAGTLARVATPARPARLAEIAKDATPPQTGSKRRPSSIATVISTSVRIPIGR